MILGFNKAEVGSSGSDTGVQRIALASHDGATTRKVAHVHARIDRQPERGERLLALAVDASEVDGAEPGRHAAHEDVGGHRQVGDEADLLRHHADARAQGVARGAEAHRLGQQAYLALVRRVHAHEDAHQRRLAGAVFSREGVDLACVQVEVHAPQGVRAAEALVKAARLEQRRHRVSGPAATP